MTQDMDAKRNKVIDRLNDSGLKPRTVDEILTMIDGMMTGRPSLAHVLLAAKEVCKVCELSRTNQHVADALASLASEVLQYSDPSLGGHGDAPHVPVGTGAWDPIERAMT